MRVSRMCRVQGDRFFNEDNLCNAERDPGFSVIVQKYENVSGRSRGIQMEIVEVKMNGVELITYLIHCAIMQHWLQDCSAHA